MTIRLRQVALAAPSLEPLAGTLCRVLGVEIAHRDPGVGIFGLENVLLPLGADGFLEIVAPVKPGTTVGRLLEKHAGQACGYMAIFQTDDLDDARRRAAAAGQHVVWEIDLGEAATFHLHPRQLGAVVSFDRMKTWGDWLWAGPEWRHHLGKGEVTGLAGVTVAVPNIADAAAKWRGLLGDAAGTVTVLPAEGPPGGLTAVTLTASVKRSAFQSRAREAGLPVTECGFRIGGVEISFP